MQKYKACRQCSEAWQNVKHVSNFMCCKTSVTLLGFSCTTLSKIGKMCQRWITSWRYTNWQENFYWPMHTCIPSWPKFMSSQWFQEHDIDSPDFRSQAIVISDTKKVITSHITLKWWVTDNLIDKMPSDNLFNIVAI